MSSKFQELGLDRLSIEERLNLIGEIWDSLTPIDQLPIPECHCKEIERRLVAADADPVVSQPWEEVRARLRREK